jgi:hypothetical protein
MSNYKAYLRKQPTLDEITGYLHFGQDKITYPDRSATILRNSPYLGIYDGLSFHELEEQEEQVEKEKLKEMKIKEIANDTGATRALVELTSSGTQTNAPVFNSTNTQTNASTSSSATSQTNTPIFNSTDTQTNTPSYSSTDTQTDLALFNMDVDDNQDEYLHYLGVERGRKKKILKDKKAKIIKIIKRHLGTEVDSVPYMPQNEPDIADDATVDYGDQDDRDTVNYGSDIDVDDVVFQNRVDKRKREADEKKDKKPKLKDEKKPVIKDEKILPIKEEGKTIKKGIKKDKTLIKQKDDDDIQISGLNINRSTDMDFWNEASAREMRSQLNLRFPGKVGDWAFKTRLQLLNIIKDKIKKGDW